MRSKRRIRLAFREAALGDVRISPQLEAALAPAVLPRTWLTHRLLLAIKEVRYLEKGFGLPRAAVGQDVCLAHPPPAARHQGGALFRKRVWLA